MRILFYISFVSIVFFSASCSEKMISRQDILDLLEDDKSSAPGNSSSTSNNASSNPNNTPISDSQNLDYHGLTNSSTGTTTGGATGYPAGANPTGR